MTYLLIIKMEYMNNKRSSILIFNRGKLVSMSLKREDGTIYMLKRDNMYLFFNILRIFKTFNRKISLSYERWQIGEIKTK